MGLFGILPSKSAGSGADWLFWGVLNQKQIILKASIKRKLKLFFNHTPSFCSTVALHQESPGFGSQVGRTFRGGVLLPLWMSKGSETERNLQEASSL